MFIVVRGGPPEAGLVCLPGTRRNNGIAAKVTTNVLSVGQRIQPCAGPQQSAKHQRQYPRLLWPAEKAETRRNYRWIF